MRFIKQLILFSSYFLLLSTVLQSEDAFVFFYNAKKQSTQGQQNSTSRVRKLLLYFIIATLAYLTLLVTPYIKTSIRTLSIWGLVIILIKYACQLLSLTFLPGIFQLAALISDVIGQSVFYLASAMMVQVISDKHGHQQTGRLYALFASLYALSILLGYAISYGCFKMVPVFLYLIILTCMTAVAGVICFFAFPQERRVQNQLHEQRQGQNAEGNRQQRQNGQINRQMMALGNIYKLTCAMYKKMLLILPILLALGIYISYSFNLLQYLVWQTQSDSIDQKLIHNLDTIIILGGGALLMSMIIGIVSDWLSMKNVGIFVCIFSTISFLTLFIGLKMKNISMTFFLYFIVGMSMFSMVVWILCACSKIFGGKFQAFSVAAQFIGMAMFIYDMLYILLQGKVNMHLRLNLQLGILVFCGVVSFLFLRKLPSGQIQVMFQQTQIVQNATNRSQQPQKQIQMKQQQMTPDVIEQQIRKQDPNVNIDPLI